MTRAMHCLIFLVLITICVNTSDLEYLSVTNEASSEEILISQFYPCQGYNQAQKPLDPYTIFQSDAEKIYICGFFDPASTEIRYAGPKFYVPVTWKHQSGGFFVFWEQHYYHITPGWFYPVLEAPDGGFPIGTYEVKLLYGKIPVASTTFEVVPAE